MREKLPLRKVSRWIYAIILGIFDGAYTIKNIYYTFILYFEYLGPYIINVFVAEFFCENYTICNPLQTCPMFVR